MLVSGVFLVVSFIHRRNPKMQAQLKAVSYWDRRRHVNSVTRRILKAVIPPLPIKCFAPSCTWPYLPACR